MIDVFSYLLDISLKNSAADCLDNARYPSSSIIKRSIREVVSKKEGSVLDSYTPSIYFLIVVYHI